MGYIISNDLKKNYSAGDSLVPAVRGINFEIEQGEFVAVMGESGSGKSTILSMLGALNFIATTIDLRARGITDFEAYLDEYPDEVMRAIRLIRTRRVNPALVALLRADSEAAVVEAGFADAELTPDVVATFRDQFRAIWVGDSSYEAEFIGANRLGEPFRCQLHWTVQRVNGIPDLSRVIASIFDVTAIRAADDELRSNLVPLNQQYPLDQVEAAAAEFFAAKHRRLSIEWTMIDGVNDSDDQADKLAAIANRLRAHVNLIALNPTPLTPDRPSSRARIEGFLAVLRRRGVNTTLRDTRGRDIDAACGQLRVRTAKTKPPATSNQLPASSSP